MPRKKPDTTTVAQDTVDTLKQEIENFHNEAEDLKRQAYTKCSIHLWGSHSVYHPLFSSHFITLLHKEKKEKSDE